MKSVWSAFVFALLSVGPALAMPLGCYPAGDVWMEYPQRPFGRDTWASYLVVPLNEATANTLLKFIEQPPGTEQMICLQGAEGRDDEIHAWDARVLSRAELKSCRDRYNRPAWYPADDAVASVCR